MHISHMDYLNTSIDSKTEVHLISDIHPFSDSNLSKPELLDFCQYIFPKKVFKTITIITYCQAYPLTSVLSLDFTVRFFFF